MKKLILVMIGAFLFLGMQTGMAIQFVSSDQTELQPSEAQAFKAALKVADEIRNKKNDVAIGEAALQCPGDNNPKFEVLIVEIKSFWQVAAASSIEKKYAGVINFLINCELSNPREEK